MAKVKGPLMSLEAHGSLASTLIFTSGKQGKNVTIHHKPTGGPSVAQQAVRANFEAAKDAWNALSSPEKEVYNENALPLQITGYNLFISEFELDDMLTASLRITSAQLLDLVANPITIVAAPGEGKVIVPVICHTILDFNSVPYTNDTGNICIGYENSIAVSPAIYQNGGLFTQSVVWADLETAATVIELSTVNQPLIYANIGGDITLGDSDILVNLLYQIVTLPT
jgi:hypothetical protein